MSTMKWLAAWPGQGSFYSAGPYLKLILVNEEFRSGGTSIKRWFVMSLRWTLPYIKGHSDRFCCILCCSMDSMRSDCRWWQRTTVRRIL